MKINGWIALQDPQLTLQKLKDRQRGQKRRDKLRRLAQAQALNQAALVEPSSDEEEEKKAELHEADQEADQEGDQSERVAWDEPWSNAEP